MGESQQKALTSRELADAIDSLIKRRIMQSLDPRQELPPGVRSHEEAAELLVRDIADALKRLDHNGGVFVVGKDAAGKEQA